MKIIHTQYTTNFRTFQNSSDPRPNPTHHYTRLTTLFRDYPGEPKGKTNLDFTEARDSKWQWHQLGRMQVCTSLQTDNHASTSALHCSVFTGRMPFLPPNQQHQSTEGTAGTTTTSSRSVAGDFATTSPARPPSSLPRTPPSDHSMTLPACC